MTTIVNRPSAIDHPMRVLVLAGGPDREREVSLNSGAEVSAALSSLGHEVRLRDVGPTDLSALDEFVQWTAPPVPALSRGEGEPQRQPPAIIFPVMHGSWGEGGALQRILDERGLPYVGCRSDAAERCMDKFLTKEALSAAGVPTPAYEHLTAAQRRRLEPPVVIKAPREGSSIDLFICHHAEDARRARSRLHHRHPHVLVEKFVPGMELTVGVLGFKPPEEARAVDGAVSPGVTALPPIQIVPAVEYYDYEAKYNRDDTQYILDIDLPPDVIASVKALAVRTFEVMGVRHMCRVDFIVDREHRPWVLEVNTIPGFTTHSLLPKAAAKAGMPMPTFCELLCRAALAEG